jgi:hypothetical protein
VAGFVAGGRAAADAIAAHHYDVLAHRCEPSRTAVGRHALQLLADAWRAHRTDKEGAT